MTLYIDVKSLREAKGWTQAELAERAGIGRDTVNRLENSRPRSIDLEVLEKLGKALGVSPGMLIKQGKPMNAPR